jgi:WhiB family redox-sensing transcriptional regulator
VELMALQASQALRGSRVQSSPNHWLAGRRVDRDQIVGTKTFGVPLDFAAGRTDLPCQQPDVDPEVFFPVATGSLGDGEVELARSFCDRCPVRQACLVYALGDTSIRNGVWGGVRFDGMHSNTRTSLLKQARQWERSA